MLNYQRVDAQKLETLEFWGKYHHLEIIVGNI